MEKDLSMFQSVLSDIQRGYCICLGKSLIEATWLVFQNTVEFVTSNLVKSARYIGFLLGWYLVWLANLCKFDQRALELLMMMLSWIDVSLTILLIKCG